MAKEFNRMSGFGSGLAAEPLPAQSSSVSGGRRSRRILLVEDEAPFRELVEAFLREEGFHVHAVGDGKCGVEWLGRNPADLVITDLCMPHTDGIELLITLRKTRSAVPIIVMSGGVAGDIAAMLRAATLLGARWALAKPFALQELATAIREVLL